MGSDHPPDLGDRETPVGLNPTSRPVGVAEASAASKILRPAYDLGRHKERQQALKAALAGLEAAELQGQRGVAPFDRHRLLYQQVAGVDAVVHEVPGDAMIPLRIEQSPNRGIQPGIPRERPVVEVHHAPAWVGENLGWKEPDVEDAEQPVAGLVHQDLEVGTDFERVHSQGTGLIGERLAPRQTADHLDTDLEGSA